jgi:serine/threonine protein phosphatase PrpC
MLKTRPIGKTGNQSSFFPTTNQRDAPDIAIYQAIGRRSEQQDRYLVSRVEDGYLLMVADGHGGSSTASFLADNVARLYAQERRRLKKKQPFSSDWGLTAANERGAIRRTISRLNRLTEKNPSGSTLTLAFLQLGTRRSDFKLQLRVHVGQMGDSVFALSTRPGLVAMPPLHSVQFNPRDVEVVKELYHQETGEECRVSGGYLYSGIQGHGLALTRSLGDYPFTLNRRPEVKTYEADPKTALILLASDGLFVPESPVRPQLKEIFSLLRSGMTIRELGDSMKHKHDNVTLLSVSFPADL